VSLNVEVHGAGPPLVLLHGFTQTARLWGPFGEALAQDFTLIRLDLPGHAGSDAVRADLPTTAALVAETVTSAIGEEPCDLLGYSLGARVALHVAVRGEIALRRIVLIGATGGIEDTARRGRRRQADEATAAALESSGDVDAFIDSWVSGPIFAGLGGAAQRAERLRNSASGLASSLRLAGTGTQEPLWETLRGVTTPAMALAGADDERFGASALRLAREMPDAVATLVSGGGHAVHLAQPATTARLVRHWLTISANPPRSRP
jgi:2-succinyl-6-hydroxy-2,4-cyclohexadiene-1-carboxylate synthase